MASFHSISSYSFFYGKFTYKNVEKLWNVINRSTLSIRRKTPYANSEKDFLKIKNDIILKSQGKLDQIKTSSSFPGSMMTAVWQKIQ